MCKKGGGSEQTAPLANLELKTAESDEPLPEMARPVQSHIDVHPKVKEIHMLYK